MVISSMKHGKHFVQKLWRVMYMLVVLGLLCFLMNSRCTKEAEHAMQTKVSARLCFINARHMRTSAQELLQSVCLSVLPL